MAAIPGAQFNCEVVAGKIHLNGQSIDFCFYALLLLFILKRKGNRNFRSVFVTDVKVQRTQDGLFLTKRK